MGLEARCQAGQERGVDRGARRLGVARGEGEFADEDARQFLLLRVHREEASEERLDVGDEIRTRRGCERLRGDAADALGEHEGDEVDLGRRV